LYAFWCPLEPGSVRADDQKRRLSTRKLHYPTFPKLADIRAVKKGQNTNAQNKTKSTIYLEKRNMFGKAQFIWKSAMYLGKHNIPGKAQYISVGKAQHIWKSTRLHPHASTLNLHLKGPLSPSASSILRTPGSQSSVSF
jgi:hypothetical protein